MPGEHVNSAEARDARAAEHVAENAPASANLTAEEATAIVASRVDELVSRAEGFEAFRDVSSRVNLVGGGYCVYVQGTRHSNGVMFAVQVVLSLAFVMGQPDRAAYLRDQTSKVMEELATYATCACCVGAPCQRHR